MEGYRTAHEADKKGREHDSGNMQEPQPTNALEKLQCWMPLALAASATFSNFPNPLECLLH